MTAEKILCKELEKIYLGKTIESDTRKPFVVAKITVRDGDYGDPPIEIEFEGQKHMEAWDKYGKWSATHNYSGAFPVPSEIEKLQNESYDEFRQVSSTHDELPIVL